MLKKVAYISFLTILLLFIPSVQAQSSVRTFYVSSATGNDANNGTSTATPWKSIAKVKATSFLPGDTILFKRGNAWSGEMVLGSSGTATSPITVGAYGTGALPKFSSIEKINLTWTQSSANVWVAQTDRNLVRANNQTIVLEKSVAGLNKPYEYYKNDGTGTGGLFVYSPSNPNTYYASNFEAGVDYSVIWLDGSYITLQDLEVVGGKFVGIGMSGNHNTVQRCAIFNTYVSGIQASNSSYNKILNNQVSSGQNYGIYVYSSQSGLVISNNIISGNQVDGFAYNGITLNGFGGTARASNNEVSNNNSFNNGDGIYFNYTDNTLVKGNDLHENTRDESWGEGYGLGIQTGSNNTIEANTMRSNRTRGIEIWGGVPTASQPGYGPSNGNKILRNKIFSNGDYGIQLSSYGYVDNTVIAYNALYLNINSALLISDEGNTGTQILNNTTYGNGSGTLFYYQLASPTLRNNLFANGGGVTMYSDSPNSNNGFAGAPLRWNGSEVSATSVTTINTTNRVGTADFVNAAAGDFSLKAGSPFINTGVGIGYTTDIRSAPLVGNPDMGAFEYGSTAGAPPTAIPTAAPTALPTATPVVSNTPTLTRTPTPTLTLVPSAAPTLRPTATPLPSSTPTRVPPSPTLTPKPATPTMSIKPTATLTPCQLKRSRGDANCDGRVNLRDLEILRTSYKSGVYDIRADFNRDRKVSLIDLQIWGETYLAQ